MCELKKIAETVSQFKILFKTVIDVEFFVCRS